MKCFYDLYNLGLWPRLDHRRLWHAYCMWVVGIGAAVVLELVAGIEPAYAGLQPTA